MEDIITSKSKKLTSFKFYLNNIYKGRIQPFDHISHHGDKGTSDGLKRLHAWSVISNKDASCYKPSQIGQLERKKRK